LANGPATIALMAFSIPPGQSGGTFTEVDVDAIVNNVVTASAGPTAPGGFQPTGIPGNWTLTFDDEFSGNSLDTTKWNTNPGWTMITDDAYMSASEISVGNGSADLRVDNFSTGGAAFTSSMINTQNKYSFTYGVAEARIQIPRGNGVDAGFWLIPNNGSWPPEIDIIELVTQVANYAIMTYHWGSANNALPQYYGGPDYSAGFHIFSVNWQPGSITWYIDGAQRAQYAVSANITNLPMYIIVNPDVCSPGTWCAGDMSSNSYPMHMAVDYVRVWQ
jgi:beta-glucanase (GH16 family)